ncbi:MAG: catalase-related domain-containing protein [Syntrophales bacterium]|nr:catalase-related domain-containing protein [Syntrophales bacterium]
MTGQRKNSQQKVLCENTGRAMGDAPEMIKIRHIGNCLKADLAYGKGVAKALGIPFSRSAEMALTSIRRGPMYGRGVCPHRANPFRKKSEWY